VAARKIRTAPAPKIRRRKKIPPGAAKVNRGRKQIQKAGREIRAIGEVQEKADRDDDADNPEALFKFKF
jgi:hypothetical protein